MKNTKRTIAIILAAVLSLSLLLTACKKSGDNPTGDNSTPGTSDAAGNNGKISEELREAVKFEFESKEPVADISKYYSADKKEFNIVKCAEEMGFDIKRTQYNGVYGDYQEKFTKERATFPLAYYFSDNDFCYVYYYSDDSRISVEVGDLTFPINFNGSQKDILITGRPETDKQLEWYKDVYASEEIINSWIGLLEYIKNNNFKEGLDLLYELGAYKTKPSFDIAKYYKSESEFDITKCAADLGYSIDNDFLVFSLPDGGRLETFLTSGYDKIGKKYHSISIYYFPPNFKALKGQEVQMDCLTFCDVTLSDTERENRKFKFIGKDYKENHEVENDYVLLSVPEINHYVAILEKVASAKTPEDLRDKDIRHNFIFGS